MTRAALIAALLGIPAGILAAFLWIALSATPDSPLNLQLFRMALEGDRLAAWLLWRWALEHYGTWISIGGSCWIAAVAWIVTGRARSCERGPLQAEMHP